MKKIIIIIIICLIFNCLCNDGGYSSKSTKGLRLNPDTLTVDDKYPPLNTSSTDKILIDGTPETVAYTILYRGKVNSVDYIAIAARNEPLLPSQTFNLKIYFQGTSIPETPYLLEKDKDNAAIRLKSGTDTYVLDSSTLTIDFNGFTPNPDGTYTISISGTATLVNGGDTKVLSFASPIIAKLIE